MTPTSRKLSPVPEPLTGPLSLQGEQQQARQTHWASPDQTDRYVRDQANGDQADEDVLICRERNRHRYPPLRRNHMRFVGPPTPEGFMIRWVQCLDCARVPRTEEWDIRSKRGGAVNYAELVRFTPDYGWAARHGLRPYLLKSGHGRIRTKDVRNTLGLIAVEGLNIKDLRKEALANQAADRDRLQAQASGGDEDTEPPESASLGA